MLPDPEKYQPGSIDKRARPNPRRCLWCYRTFRAAYVKEDYCGAECQRAYNNWRRRVGAVIFDLMLEFRGPRRQGSFTRMCQEADAALESQRTRWRLFERERADLKAAK